MKAGRNVWVSWHGKEVKSETRPAETASDRWFPKFPASRVHGDSYRPYTGGSEWEQAANNEMAAAAQANFAQGR